MLSLNWDNPPDCSIDNWPMNPFTETNKNIILLVPTNVEQAGRRAILITHVIYMVQTQHGNVNLRFKMELGHSATTSSPSDQEIVETTWVNLLPPTGKLGKSPRLEVPNPLQHGPFSRAKSSAAPCN